MSWLSMLDFFTLTEETSMFVIRLSFVAAFVLM
jgi:hypothetical protein